MGESAVRLRVAGELLEESSRALSLGLPVLASIGSVLAVENSIDAVVSCFRTPSSIRDRVLDLTSVLGEFPDRVKHLEDRLSRLVELSQYVLYTYGELVRYGDPAAGRTPSELLGLEEVEELVRVAGEVVGIARYVVEELGC
ncbi:MAG: hypothetical protein LM564_01345 [Desulfurococcaceae archaeon]|jgi:HEPN domain-containing protein|nr:hypothetical protein [Desulfurococcaceae archaeon]